ncbi:MAG: dTDP-4-dehydrorhamnose 3,5-epimerase [Lachnospiraceae bacterium]|nr:dTDP-4-dehydrorhamnose 3,5-epimerase [Lachnospiraceae bacterium]
MGFQIREGNIQGLKIITPDVFKDDRGYFLKYYEKEMLKEIGVDLDIAESFETMSKRNVIRGMHFQTMEPQDKLVRVISGEIYDVAVDIRKNSPTYGHYDMVRLSDYNREMFYIPAGFAHGFCVVSDVAIVSYTCRGRYIGQADTGIVYNDPDIAINWPVENPIVSNKDAGLMTLRTFYDQFQGL